MLTAGTLNQIDKYNTQPTENSDVPLILALDTSGQPRDWITWQQAVFYHAKDLVAWQLGEDDFTFRGGISRMTGERSKLSTQSIIAIKGLDVVKTNSKKREIEPPLSNKLLFRRDHNICAYCGGEFTYDQLTRDHVMPESRGGKTKWKNLVAACKKCNHHKGDKFAGENGDWQLLYVPYVPNKYEYLILANRRILADQMEFLKSGVPQTSRILRPPARKADRRK